LPRSTRASSVGTCSANPDYLLWVAAADLAAYEQLFMSKLVGLPGVARKVSQLTMKTIKPGGGLPL
jgi:Lrp/AsnC family leucine-responsive transcriptional regulator